MSQEEAAVAADLKRIDTVLQLAEVSERMSKVMAVVEDNSEFLGPVERDHPGLYKRAMGGRGDENHVLLKGEERRAAVERMLNEEDSDLED